MTVVGSAHPIVGKASMREKVMSVSRQKILEVGGGHDWPTYPRLVDTHNPISFSLPTTPLNICRFQLRYNYMPVASINLPKTGLHTQDWWIHTTSSSLQIFL